MTAQGTCQATSAPDEELKRRALQRPLPWDYLVSAGVLALILIITLFMIRVRRQDLSGSGTEPASDASSPDQA
jgi:hypothetical protein